MLDRNVQNCGIEPILFMFRKKLYIWKTKKEVMILVMRLRLLKWELTYSYKKELHLDEDILEMLHRLSQLEGRAV